MEQRTAMLAGVSHDLRTILTRFKLELALIGDSPEMEGMRKDVDEMSMMLEDYLAFARGNSGEQSQPTDMAQALEELRSDAERHGHMGDGRVQRAARGHGEAGLVQALPCQPRHQRRPLRQEASPLPASAITAI